jgi:hypothetical protein
VVVSGGAPGDVTRRLFAKGLSAETTREGAIVRPSLPLRDAVTLSNDLRGDGFTVTVRRVAGGGDAAAPAAPAAAAPAAPPAAAAPTAPSAPATAAGETLHRVRVGAFPDRAAANAAVAKLRELGYTPFVARGRE